MLNTLADPGVQFVVQIDDRRPRWVRDLERFLPLKSQFVLTGNVRDLQTRDVGGRVIAAPLSDVLASTFR
ncbi:hypothetical protein ACHWGL_31305, partial [Klebsiella pneumoniae]|uniref:hypothetical protein n=2 Tax=Pseudomonadota TaxID=1224 RepID=UPI00376F0F23